MTAVRVYVRATEAIDAVEYERLMALLPDGERARAARFVAGADRVSFVAAHALLRERLSRQADVAPSAWTFDTNAFGKPAVAGPIAPPDLSFNLAHTRGLVACAIGKGVDVGIDVERLDHGADPMAIATRYFSPAECSGLEACAGDEQRARFTELWTLKEAYIKAVGHGLSHPLDTFGFDLGDGPEIRATLPSGEAAERWGFALWAPSPGFRLAVAVRGEDPAGMTLELPASSRPCILARLSSGVSLSFEEASGD